jgi:hypothetical protein
MNALYCSSSSSKSFCVLLDCGRTNLNYTGSSALILSRKSVKAQLHFKWYNPMVCQVKSR